MLFILLHDVCMKMLGTLADTPAGF